MVTRCDLEHICSYPTFAIVHVKVTLFNMFGGVVLVCDRGLEAFFGHLRVCISCTDDVCTHLIGQFISHQQCLFLYE